MPRGRQRRTWNKITNEIIAQDRIIVEAKRRRSKLEEELRQLELALYEKRKANA